MEPNDDEELARVVSESAMLLEREELDLAMAMSASSSSSYETLPLPPPARMLRQRSAEKKWCMVCFMPNELHSQICYMCEARLDMRSPVSTEDNDAAIAQALMDGDDASANVAAILGLNEEQMGEMLANQMHVDMRSGAEFERLLGVEMPFFDSPASITPRHPVPSHHQSHFAADQVVQLVADGIAAANAPVGPGTQINLGGLADHGQNVHNAAVEQPSDENIDNLCAKANEHGLTDDDMLESLVAAIEAHPENLAVNVADGAIRELRNEGNLQLQHRGKSYKRLAAAVWNRALKHKSSTDIARRLAEEIHEGTGQCTGGKFGRLINSLRGFVNIGNQIAEAGQGQAFQNAFTQRVVNNEGLTAEEKRAEAIRVLEEYGIEGEMRQQWLDAI